MSEGAKGCRRCLLNNLPLAVARARPAGASRHGRGNYRYGHVGLLHRDLETASRVVRPAGAAWADTTFCASIEEVSDARQARTGGSGGLVFHGKAKKGRMAGRIRKDQAPIRRGRGRSGNRPRLAKMYQADISPLYSSPGSCSGSIEIVGRAMKGRDLGRQKAPGANLER